MHVLDEAAAQTVLGQHALHHADEQGVHAGLHMLVEALLDEYLGSELALTAGIAGVVEIDTVGHLFTGEAYLLGVDDDNIVAALHVGGVAGLVLAAEQQGDFRAQTAKGLVGCVNHHPLVFYALCVR